MKKISYFQQYTRHTLLLTLLLTLSFRGETVSFQINQTQKHLAKISNQISHIKTTISDDIKHHHEIKNKMTITETALEKTLKDKLALQKKIMNLNVMIQSLKASIHNNQVQIKSSQNEIYQHLKLQLMLSQEPYWQIVFGAENPFDYYQRLELYQYLNESEQLQFKTLNELKNELQQQQGLLKQNIENLSHLQNKLSAKQRIYVQEQKVHQQHLDLMNKKINQHTAELHLFEKNQQNIKKLMQTLLKENTLQSRRPFTVMKHQLSLPIYQTETRLQNIQNGIMFVAPENTTVHAVSPGKVVFADWLNGYGYLIILDHGWGFMTLYGNNHALLKHRGQYVNAGEVVSTVGKSGAFHQTGLYFELRQRAKVIAARTWFKQKPV